MMTINFHNSMRNPDLYLFFDFADTGTSGASFDNMTYYQPWKDGALPLDNPYVCTLDWINSGTFWYIVANETGSKTITSNPNTAMGTADPNWVGGFFEMTSLEKDKKVYFDITNVDQVGLLCGVRFNNSPETCGYGHSATNFMSGLITECGLESNTDALKTITGTDGKSYSKLWGPTVAEVSSLYDGDTTEYLNKISANNTGITINSDSTINSGHAGTQLDSYKFTGKWGAPDSLPAGAELKKEDVIFWMETDASGPLTEKTMIYFTESALNGGTIMSGSSAGGMYVYPAFEYADPTTPSTIDKGGWANDVSLNWTATGANAVTNTTCFQAMISSVGRDLITALNLAYIGISATTNNFVYGDASTYATAATQEKYINKWNKYITGNSDSYGMAYSDNAHAKVLFNPPIDGTIDCYLFGQSDPETGNYWSKNSNF